MELTDCHPTTLLRLRLTPGLGPTLARRLVSMCTSDAQILGASATLLKTIPGIGEGSASKIADGLADSSARTEGVLARCAELGIRAISVSEIDYPPLLRAIPDAPLTLFVRGNLPILAPDGSPTYRVAIVGSRRCTAYGIEQSERFAAALTQHGITVVSGGARGIDTAAHRATVRVKGATIAVLGSGHAKPYPPENKELFESIIDAGGAVVSELTPDTRPAAEHFPSRNRIISGLSIATLVIEAPAGSGALITARTAVEDQNREVYAIPGRADTSASAGSNSLIRKGEAGLVTSPAELLTDIESPARHLFAGTHTARFQAPAHAHEVSTTLTAPKPSAVNGLSDMQRTVLDAASEDRSPDELVRLTGLEASTVRSALTMLELKGLIKRNGTKVRSTVAHNSA